MADPLVIVGAGMAAAYLVEALRSHRGSVTSLPHRPIVLIGEESRACYNRILLSTVLAERAELSDLHMLDAGDDVHLRTGCRVTGIDTDSRSIDLSNGESLQFSDLVLATGARVATPVDGLDGVGGVHSFRTLEDLEQLRFGAASVERAIVIGAGLLGLEAAWGLAGLGVDVTVVHRQPHILNRQLDIGAAELLRARFEEEGVNFLLNSSLARVDVTDNRVRGVHTVDGNRLDGELLVMATGITPNTHLASAAGLAVDHGILVDEWLQTGCDHVYGLGECVQRGDDTFGLVAPIREQADVLARRLLGLEAEPFVTREYSTQLKISGIDVFSAGVIDEPAETITLTSRAQRVYRRLFIRENRLIGAVLVGNRRGANSLEEIIRRGTDIRGFRDQLMFGNIPPLNAGSV